MRGDDDMQLIHFKKGTDCAYPVGASFNKNRDYIVEVARTIHTIAGREGSVALICRGTSGAILAGAVGYILKKKQHDVRIIVSRKREEDSHDYNMSGIEIFKSTDRPFSVIDMLCVDNCLSDEKVGDFPIIYELLQRFNYVLCNKVREEDNDKPV